MYRVKGKVNQMENDYGKQYALLRRYGEEMMKTNPNTTVKIKCKIIGDEARFKRFYVCWGALKACMLDGCRPMIFLYGCHLKTAYGGILLTAIGIDVNNCMYPFAFAVVEKEKYKSWLWFLNLVVTDLNITNSYTWTVMSDKQKGLINVVKNVLPDCEHRFCVFHLYSNFKLKYKGLALKEILWKTAKATRVVDFERDMEELKSHFSTNSKCDVLLNNMSESFNALILRARAKPIINILEIIRLTCMKRLVTKRAQMLKWNGMLCPKIEKLVEEGKVKAMSYTTHWNGHNEFEVVNINQTRRTVHLGHRMQL